MRAMILAAGYGTRLWPLTVDRTKPAIPFLGRPLVGYVAQYLAGFGCIDVIVNLHHRPQSVREALGDGSSFGVKMHYIEEPNILGTSGALDNARALLEGETFIVVNGKIITDIDLSAALETHKRMKALATLVLRPNPLRERFSIVQTLNGLVTGFGGMPHALNSEQVAGNRKISSVDVVHDAASDNADEDEIEKQSIEKQSAPLMFTGIQILEPRIFDYIPRGVFSHSTTDVYPRAIAKGERIAAHQTNDEWYELSTIQRYLEISLAMMSKAGRDVQTGNRTQIAPDATVMESVLWDDVSVEAGANVRRAVIGDGVRIGGQEILENVAVVRADLLRGEERPLKALPGYVLGDNFVVPLGQ